MSTALIEVVIYMLYVVAVSAVSTRMLWYGKRKEGFLTGGLAFVIAVAVVPGIIRPVVAPFFLNQDNVADISNALVFITFGILFYTTYRITDSWLDRRGKVRRRDDD